MANESVQMPGGFGGLTRFSEEYDSKINLKPTHILIFIALIVVFRAMLGLFY